MTKEKVDSVVSLTQEELQQYLHIPDPEIRKRLKTESENFFYPDSTVYKNKYNIKKQKEFNEKSSNIAKAVMEKLRLTPPPNVIDSSYLKSLHQQMFSDVFEWAGVTREQSFTFKDGSTASMPLLKKKDFHKPFAAGREIQRGLKKLDEMILEKGNLEQLSREEFIEHASQVMAHLYSLNPFREGNRRAIQLFTEKLGQAAGYDLNYSTVSKKRKDFVRKEVVNNNNVEPLKHLLEDISHPEKVLIFNEFTNSMQQLGLGENNYSLVVAAKDGHTYKGIYRGGGDNGFMMDAGGTLILGHKKYLSPEQVRTLKIGDHLSFTAPLAEEARKVFIPKETIPPLSNEELSKRVYDSIWITSSVKRLEDLCKIVYGNKNALKNKLPKFTIPITSEDIAKGEKFARLIEERPQSAAKVRGFSFFGFKSSARQHAKENFLPLGHAVNNYVHSLKNAQRDILENHSAEQKRCAQSVEPPSENVKRLFFLPAEERKRILLNSPELGRETEIYFQKLNERLSSNELYAIENRLYLRLADLMGISVSQAGEIAAVTRQTKEIVNTIQQMNREMSQKKDLDVSQSIVQSGEKQSSTISAKAIQAKTVVEFFKKEIAVEQKIQPHEMKRAEIESHGEKTAEKSIPPIKEKKVLEFTKKETTPDKQAQQHKVGYVSWESDSEKTAEKSATIIKEKRTLIRSNAEGEQSSLHKVGHIAQEGDVKQATEKDTTLTETKKILARANAAEEHNLPHKTGHVAWESGAKQTAESAEMTKATEEQTRPFRGKSLSI